MTVKFCRIDDRLIHGQVVTTWLNVYKIEQVIIVNETVAKDKIQSKVLEMSIPSNVKLHIFSPDKFLRVTKKAPITRSTMLLFTNPFDVEKLIQNGFEIDKLNVGGMRGNDQRKQYTKAVFLTNDEKTAFERLIAQGVDVEIQMIPTNPAEKMSEVIAK
ncbi:PTS mannose/fructose/sorbose transporter subunit IIB [Bombilactobacillus bombi]|uniref:PTS system mannose/fructose/N-acetylgalactosamine-transporter subunit IIB n=1 Tax=Bombilactobacillus bombi TaxID=1303590 RepID=UPI000E57D84A|nr:PTS sugar transporter subunit IIB [Bombilactobacillus bombi]AXX65225.1 PTS mannose/fructose/sorbose transporter subunit IIB [Bombilactobacillus bombi]